MADVHDGSAIPQGAAPEEVTGSTAFWASICFMFVMFMAPQQFLPVLATLRIVLVTALIAAVALVIDRLGRRQPLTVLTPETRLAAALALWATLTIPLSYSPAGTLSFLFGIYFKSLAVFWLLSNTVNTPARLYQFAWAVSLMAVPLAWTAVSNFASGFFLPGLPEFGPRRIVGYDAPLTANPNDLAFMLNLIIPLSVALLLTAPRPALRALLVVVILLDVVAVIVTFSRGGFLTLVAISAIYAWKLRARPERSWAWAPLALALVLLPLLPTGYVERVATITDIESDGSAQERWSDIRAAASVVSANPIIGAGAGMNTVALGAVQGRRWKHHAVHNIYLEYAVDLGLPGLILFLLLLVRSTKSASLVQQRADGMPGFRRVFHLAQGIQVSLMAFAVAALFHPGGFGLHFYYVAALAVAVKVLWAAQESKAVPVLHTPANDAGRFGGYAQFSR